MKILNYIDTDVVDVENRNYYLELDEDKYNKHLFKLILIHEVIRFAEPGVHTVKTFITIYHSLNLN